MEHKKGLCGYLDLPPETVASDAPSIRISVSRAPYLAATLGAAVHRPLLAIPVLDSIVVAERGPPQLIDQLFVLFSLKGGERSLASSLTFGPSASSVVHVRGLVLAGGGGGGH